MQRFSAERFYRIGNTIQLLKVALQGDIDTNNLSIDDKAKATVKEWLKRVSRDCKAIGLRISVKAADALIRVSDQKVDETFYQNLTSGLSQLEQNIEWEMQDVKFFHMPLTQAENYDQNELFGLDVNSKFPTVQFDMVEAGNCFAMGRGTACVFHLMRIMEVGVQQLGSKLGVALANEKNWQNILDETNKAIKVLGPKDAATVAMCQASANLYAVKLAWRNEVMHPNDKYTLEEAKDLIRAVKMFMKQLASII